MLLFVRPELPKCRTENSWNLLPAPISGTNNARTSGVRGADGVVVRLERLPELAHGVERVASESRQGRARIEPTRADGPPAGAGDALGKGNAARGSFRVRREA